MPELNETSEDYRDVTKDPMMVKAEDAEEPTETRSDVAIDSEDKMNISPHVMKAGDAEEPKCEAQVAVEDIIEMSIEVKAEDTKEPEEPILVRVANVKKLDMTAELCKDAASEPVMVKAEDAEEPREAAQTAVEDILEMSMEMKAEYAKEHEELAEVASEDTPEDAAVHVENTESASPVVPGPGKQGGLGVAWWAPPHPPDPAPCVGLGYQ